MPRRPEHRRSKKKPRRKTRGTAHQRGYTSKWTKYSESLRSLPGYESCYICGAPTQCIDHVVAPISKFDQGTAEYDELFWDENNHAPACKTCNEKKGAGQDKDYHTLWLEWRKKLESVDVFGF